MISQPQPTKKEAKLKTLMSDLRSLDQTIEFQVKAALQADLDLEASRRRRQILYNDLVALALLNEVLE